jgi:hypothetical protein
MLIPHTLLKGKGKVHPRTGHEGPWALDGVGGQRDAPATLLPGKARYSSYRRLVRPQGPSGWVRNISPPPGFDSRTVQPTVSRYSNCTIPAHTHLIGNANLRNWNFMLSSVKGTCS